jgi:hypothetical protein
MTNWVAFVASAASCVASVGILLPSRWQNLAVARRLAWVSAVCGIPIGLRQAREVLTGRKAPWALLGQLGLAGTGIAGIPWVAAGTAVVARAMELHGNTIGAVGAADERIADGADLLAVPLCGEEGEKCLPSYS